jgi:hypothetical protein
VIVAREEDRNPSLEPGQEGVPDRSARPVPPSALHGVVAVGDDPPIEGCHEDRIHPIQLGLDVLPLLVQAIGIEGQKSDGVSRWQCSPEGVVASGHGPLWAQLGILNLGPLVALHVVVSQGREEDQGPPEIPGIDIFEDRLPEGVFYAGNAPRVEVVPHREHEVRGGRGVGIGDGPGDLVLPVFARSEVSQNQNPEGRADGQGREVGRGSGGEGVIRPRLSIEATPFTQKKEERGREESQPPHEICLLPERSGALFHQSNLTCFHQPDGVPRHRDGSIDLGSSRGSP